MSHVPILADGALVVWDRVTGLKHPAVKGPLGDV